MPWSREAKGAAPQPEDALQAASASLTRAVDLADDSAQSAKEFMRKCGTAAEDFSELAKLAKKLMETTIELGNAMGVGAARGATFQAVFIAARCCYSKRLPRRQDCRDLLEAIAVGAAAGAIGFAAGPAVAVACSIVYAGHCIGTVLANE